MADLPQVSRDVVTTKATTTSVSAADINAPFAHLGRALDSVNEAAQTAGEIIGKEAGRNAVTTDENGDLQVSAMPWWTGAAGGAYNRAAYTSYVAQLEPRIKDQVAAHRREMAGNPEAFRDWGHQYVDELAGGQPNEAFAQSVRLLATRHVQESYQGLANAKFKQDTDDQRTAIDAQRTRLDNEMAAIARDGGTETENYKARAADYDSLTNEAASNPALGLSKAQADLQREEMATRHTALAVVGQTRRIAEDKELGPAKAEAFARGILTDPGYNLDQEKRQHYYRLAVGEIKQLSAENRVAISQLTTEGAQWVKAINGGEASTEDVQDYLNRASEAGAVKAVSNVISAASTQSYLKDWFDKLPAADRARAAAVFQGKPAAPGTFETRLSGRESSGNAALVNQLGYAGLYQFGAPRLADLGVYTPGAGEDLKTWSKTPAAAPDKWSGTFNIPGFSQVKTLADFLKSPEAQRAVYTAHEGRMDKEAANLGLDQFIGQSVGGVTITRDSIRAMTHLGGAGGASAFLKSGGAVDPADANGTKLSAYARTLGGAAPAIPDAVRGDPTFLNAVRKRAGEDLTRQFPDVEKAVNSGRPVSPEEMESFGALVYAVGSDQQKQRALELGVKAAFGAAYQHANPQEREVLRGQLHERWAAGAPEFEREVAGYADGLDKQITQAYKADPYQASVDYGQRKATAPLTFGTTRPDDLVARIKEQGVIRQQEGVDPFSVFRPAEAQAWKIGLTQGDPAAAGQALATLATTLPPDIYKATMAAPEMKDALTGMVQSYDPTRLSTGMGTLDRLWRADPQFFAGTFGEGTLHRMQVWQGIKDSRSPLEVAEFFKRADDPAMAKARKELGSTAQTEIAAMKPQDVANAFGADGWFNAVTPGPVARNVTGSDPAAPMDELKAAAFKADFAATYQSLRQDGVPADQAKTLTAERMSKVSWGATSVVGPRGGLMMRFPPEKSPAYPAIDGSHDWLRKDIDAAVTAAYGPQYKSTAVRGDVLGASPEANWSVQELLSDDHTEADFASGRPPRYQVAVMVNGKRELLRDKASGGTYFTFDKGAHLEAARSKFNVQQQRAERVGDFEEAMGLRLRGNR